jgi:hypothetical protein
MIGYHVCYTNLLYLYLALDKYRLCDNIIKVSFIVIVLLVITLDIKL